MAPTYSRDNLAALPTDDATLSTTFASPADYNAVASNDGTTVDQSGTEGYALFNWEETALGNSGTFTWKGESTKAPSESVVKIQIYKRIGTGAPVWEDVPDASDNSTAADTNFTISGTVSDLTNYKEDITNKVVLRTWQAASAGGEITSLTTMASWSEIWSSAAQTTDSSLAYYLWTSAKRCYRHVLLSTYITAGATVVRIKFNQADPGYTDPIVMASCYIGDRDTEEPVGFYLLEAPTQVQKGESNSFSIGYGSGFEYSDPIVFTIDETKDYLINFYQNDVAWRTPYRDLGSGGINSRYKSPVTIDESTNLTSADYSPDTTIFILEAVEKDTSGFPFVYSATLETEPSAVTENGTPLTNRATKQLTNDNAGSWHWESNTIYIRPTTLALDPPYMWS